MNDEQRNRAILHDIEGDWRVALEEMQEVQANEFRQYKRRLGDIHRGYRAVALGVAVNSALLVAIVVAGFVLFGHQSDVAERIAQRAARGLCALRADVQERVDQGTAFLRSHPEGLRGFPPGAIRVSIANSARTVRALSGLQCPTP